MSSKTQHLIKQGLLSAPPRFLETGVHYEVVMGSIAYGVAEDHSDLYALRALLCAKWIVDERQVPPVEFAKLTERYLQASEISAQLAVMLEQKAVSSEGDKFPVPDPLWAYADRIYSELQETSVKECREGDIGVYDSVLREFWQQ